MSKVMVYIITILDDQQPSCKGGMDGSFRDITMNHRYYIPFARFPFIKSFLF